MGKKMERYLMRNIVTLIMFIGMGYSLVTCSKAPSQAIINSAAERSPSMERAPSISFTQLKRFGKAVNAEGQPTTYILATSKNGDLLDIYLVDSAIKRNSTPQNKRLAPKQIELRVNSKGTTFFQANAYTPEIYAAVESTSTNEVVIHIPATLLHSASGTPLNIAPLKLLIDGENFKIQKAVSKI